MVAEQTEAMAAGPGEGDVMTDQLTRAQLRKILKAIRAVADIDKDTRNAIVCALVGHSRIQETCFGYFHCGRCEEQVGDNLAGVYDAGDVVIIGHDCNTCRANYEDCTWRDKLYVRDPLRRGNDG